MHKYIDPSEDKRIDEVAKALWPITERVLELGGVIHIRVAFPDEKDDRDRYVACITRGDIGIGDPSMIAAVSIDDENVNDAAVLAVIPFCCAVIMRKEEGDSLLDIGKLHDFALAAHITSSYEYAEKILRNTVNALFNVLLEAGVVDKDGNVYRTALFSDEVEKMIAPEILSIIRNYVNVTDEGRDSDIEQQLEELLKTI